MPFLSSPYPGDAISQTTVCGEVPDQENAKAFPKGTAVSSPRGHPPGQGGLLNGSDHEPPGNPQGFPKGTAYSRHPAPVATSGDNYTFLNIFNGVDQEACVLGYPGDDPLNPLWCRMVPSGRLKYASWSQQRAQV